MSVSTGPWAPEKTPLSANALQLSPREWLAAAAGLLLVLLAFPAFRSTIKSPQLPADYRIPYALTDRYDLYERYSVLAAPRYDTLLVGDSCIWGQCADWNGTLSHHLNSLSGGERFANLGLDGMHPVALSVLMRHHASGIAGKPVILQANLFWFVSTGVRRTREDLLKNRPNLGPRFGPTVTVYDERFLHLLGNWLEETPSLGRIQTRLQEMLPDRLDSLGWTLEHPYENPFRTLSFSLPMPEKKAPQTTTPYLATRVSLDQKWDPIDKTPMWLGFKETVAILQEHGNKVTVMVGPYNEAVLSERSRAALGRIKESMAAWCTANDLRCLMPEPLAADLYTDTCHPTNEGYAELARRLRQDYPDLFAK